jgi:hypothetical protein
MTQPAMRPSTTPVTRPMPPRAEPNGARPRWPMTPDALRRLVDDLRELESDLAVMAGAAPEPGVVHLPMALAGRRFETLTAVLGSAEEVDDPDRAVIGRRAVLREADGQSVSYALVFPGDGDPSLGWISGDSPMGSAVLGARAGDVVEVDAPAGRRSITVVAVD